MVDRDPGTPEVAPPGQVEPGREGTARPLAPGAGLETGEPDREGNAGEPKAPPFGVTTEPGGAGRNPRT